MKTSSARAHHPGCAGLCRGGPAVFQPGSARDRKKNNKKNVSTDTATCHLLHLFLYDLDSFMTARCLRLHITFSLLHNFCSSTLFLRNSAWRQLTGGSTAHGMCPTPNFNIQRMSSLMPKVFPGSRIVHMRA